MDFPASELLSYLSRSKKSVNKLTNLSKSYNNEGKYNKIKVQLQSLKPSKVHFFGVRFMGLGSRFSDLDMFIETGASFFEPIDFDENRKLVLEYAEYLKSNKIWKVDHIFVDPAPGPMIKAIHKGNHLACEISFTSGLNVVNTRLIAFLFKMQPEAIKLYHFVRIWIHICGLSFEQYLVCNLVIYYLQQKNFMPAFKTMKIMVKTVQKVGAFEVQFDDKLPLTYYGVSAMKNYRDEAAGFFQFYANFDFVNDVVFPYLGTAIAKQNYPNNQELQQFRENIKDFKWKKPMAVAGMIDLNFNCSWDIKEKRLQKFVENCRESVLLLTNNI
ncbi:unnamed protein product [Diamesa hyperborea]